MIWALSALAATFFFSITNFVDKYVLHRHLGNLSNVSYMSLAGVAVAPFLLVALVIDPEPIVNSSFSNALFPFIAGILFTGAFAIYLKCLSRSDTSMTASLFQLTIFWNLILGWLILHEHVSAPVIAAMFVLLAATFFLSHEIDDDGKRKVRHEIYLWMFLACLLLSISDVLFKYSIEHGQTYFAAQFYDYLASVIVSLLVLLLYKKTFNELMRLFEAGAKILIAIVLLNETINLIGSALGRLSIIHLPIASAQAIMGVQPLLLITMGIVVTKLWPGRFHEKLGKRHVGEKVAAASIIVVAEVIIVAAL